jgi:eukaryotic-like serine/threonine-protein kinase
MIERFPRPNSERLPPPLPAGLDGRSDPVNHHAVPEHESKAAPSEAATPTTRKGGAGAAPSPSFDLRASGEHVGLGVGKYRFLAALGHGGMADVYLAVAVGPAGFSKLSVIKRLRPSLAHDPDLCAMFLDEARLAARLNHRNVVQTNEVGLDEGQYFIAMEYLDGQPYNRIFSRARQAGKKVPLGIALRILCDVLAGLHYAHDLADYDGTPLHVVHRDVSPHNVFVTYDGQTKVVDFGIAKAARRMVETQAGVIKGKVSYMAPEQAFLSSSEVDRRADVFSVGVMLWEAIAGRRLWHGMGDPEIIAKLIEDIPRVIDAVPDAPEGLARISEKALARERDDRYASAAELRADLEPWIEKVGPDVTAEELGAFVADMFADPRAELRAVIDRQLAAIDAAPETRREPSAPSLRLPEIRGSIPPEDLSPAEVRIRSLPPPPSGASTPPPSTNTTLRAAVLGQEGAPAARARAPIYAAAVAALAAAGTAAWLFRGRAPEASPPPITTAVESAQAAPPATAHSIVLPAADDPNAIHARFSVNPAEGRILIDGAPLPSNPFDGRFPRDGMAHRLQFEAAGFLPQSRIIVFDKDVALDLSLQPKPRSGAADPTGGGLKPKASPYDDPRDLRPQ